MQYHSEPFKNNLKHKTQTQKIMHKSEILTPMRQVDEYVSDPFGKNDTGGLYCECRTAYDYYREYGDSTWIAPLHIYTDHKDLSGIGQLYEACANLPESDNYLRVPRSELINCINARFAYYKAKYPQLEGFKLDSDIGHAFLIHSFERPSAIMEKFGLLECCVELKFLYTEKILKFVDADPTRRQIGDFKRAMTEFLFSRKNPMDTVSEFSEWPKENSHTMEHFLDSYKLPSIQKFYGAKTWVIPLKIYQHSLELIGLSDLHFILNNEQAIGYTVFDEGKAVISKELKRCINIKFDIIQKTFPYSQLDIENAPATQLLLDSAAPLTKYTDDFYDYVPLGRITIPNDFREKIKIKAGLGDEEFGFMKGKLLEA